MRVAVPDDHDDPAVPIPGTEPDDRAYMGRRAPDVVRVREDDAGRYVGVSVHQADAVMDHLADEYGVEYDRDTGDLTDGRDGGVADAESDATTDTSEDDGDEDADDAPTCAGTTADGETCTREVDEPGDYCFQHSPDGGGSE